MSSLPLITKSVMREKHHLLQCLSVRGFFLCAHFPLSSLLLMGHGTFVHVVKYVTWSYWLFICYPFVPLFSRHWMELCACPLWRWNYAAGGVWIWEWRLMLWNDKSRTASRQQRRNLHGGQYTYNQEMQMMSLWNSNIGTEHLTCGFDTLFWRICWYLCQKVFSV